MTLTERIKRSLEVFLVLFKIGSFTFGGGWSIIAQMQKEFINKRNWLNEDDLLDLISVAKSLPGIMIINVAVIFGYNVGGPICAIAAVLGVASPSVLILTLVTFFYSSIRDNVYMSKALVGVRAAVVPIIFSAVFKLKKSALVDYIGYIFATTATLLCLFTNINSLVVVALGAVAGLIIKGGHRHAIT